MADGIAGRETVTIFTEGLADPDVLLRLQRTDASGYSVTLPP